MSKTVPFLGAGATKACGGPLTNEILPKIHRADRRRSYQARIRSSRKEGTTNSKVWPTALVKALLEDEFHVDLGDPESRYASLPFVFSLIDTALDKRQAFSGKWNYEKGPPYTALLGPSS